MPSELKLLNCWGGHSCLEFELQFFFFPSKEILLYYFWIHSHWEKTNAMDHKSPGQSP